MREVKFATMDFDLFDKDITPSDYEFFSKHTGAFKRLFEDQSKDKKFEFIHAFEVFSMKHGCIRKLGGGDDATKYARQTINYYTENFSEGKLSTAKMLVTDAACLAQNRSMLQNLGSRPSHGKDPFYHKDTRDTFRRLFGHPSDKEAHMKILCALPLHIKFGGSLCRYLRRWLDTDDRPEHQKLPSERSCESVTTPESDRTPPNSKATKSASERSTQEPKASDVQRKPTEAKAGKTKMPSSQDKKSASEASGKQQQQQRSSSKTKPPKRGQNYMALRLVGLDPQSQTLSFSSIDEQNSDQSTLLETDNIVRKLREIEARDGDDGSTCQLYKIEQDGSMYRLRDAMHLGKPHPNEIFDNMRKQKEKSEEKEENDAAECGKARKLHTCSNCRKVEHQPKSYKKCQLCKGKRTRFYCSRECQAEDWTSRHRQEHETPGKTELNDVQ